LDRLTLIFSASVIAASVAFAALPWRSMNSAAAEGYAQASEAQPIAPVDNVASARICPGRAVIPANVAAADPTN
jgi:hypothetical protein